MNTSRVFRSLAASPAIRPSTRAFGSLTSRTALPYKTESGTVYGGKHTVTLIPGDGVGPELVSSVKTLFKALNVPVEFEQFDVSGHNADGKLLKEAIDSIRRNKVALKGILYTPVDQTLHSSFNGILRKELDIYASVASIANMQGDFKTRHNGVDFAIVRENTEGEYAGLEHSPVAGVVESLKVVTKAKSERIAKFAFDFALKNGRKKVTCIHKANIMKQGDGLFLNTCREVSKLYENAGIKFNDMIVDNAAMQLSSKPQQFDVIVAGNLYGNILSNIGAGLIGGPGIVPGVNIGRDYAVYEPGCRHIGADIQGQNVANPTSMIMCSVHLLRHIGLEDHANRIASAVVKVIAESRVLTPDLGGSNTTSDFTLAVMENL